MTCRASLGHPTAAMTSWEHGRRPNLGRDTLRPRQRHVWPPAEMPKASRIGAARMETGAAAVIAGVDTHKDARVLCGLDSLGRKIVEAAFPAAAEGCRGLARTIGDPAACLAVGVEGACSFGAGLTAHLLESGLNVVEVLRPKRGRRRRGSRKKRGPISARRRPPPWRPPGRRRAPSPCPSSNTSIEPHPWSRRVVQRPVESADVNSWELKDSLIESTPASKRRRMQPIFVLMAS